MNSDILRRVPAIQEFFNIEPDKEYDEVDLFADGAMQANDITMVYISRK